MKRLAALASAALLTACGSAEPAPTTSSPTATASATRSASASAETSPAAAPSAIETPTAMPDLQVATVADGLTLPWDLAELDDGSLLVTQKAELDVVRVAPDGAISTVSKAPEGGWSSGETGLMSLVVDPADESRVLICHGYSAGGTTDVRVTEWSWNAERSELTETGPLLTGIPASSGRHGGCRLLFSDLPDGDPALFVGTGDAAVETNPQDRSSLGGKVLRIDPQTGEGMADNPFADSDDADTRRIWTYGHRNVQGLAELDGRLWSAEHGPDRDDEVNVLQSGGNYGWNPGPGYDEGVPMTDSDLDGTVVEAAWSSGDSTIAISGLGAVEGARWGRLAGGLAVAALKGQQLKFLLTDGATVVAEESPAQFTEYGRLRSVHQSSDGSLLVTTSNGSDDQILRITPS